MRLVFFSVIFFMLVFSTSEGGENNDISDGSEKSHEKTVPSPENRIFGFYWRMSPTEANKVAHGKLRMTDAKYGKSVYKMNKPAKPSGANAITLSFFNDELYEVVAYFVFFSTYDLSDKFYGVCTALKAKHPEGDRKLDAALGRVLGLYKTFSYSEEGSDTFAENPYNLEKILVTGFTSQKGLAIAYNFYGSQKIATHLKALSDKAEFGDF